ncbi:Lysine--tRNA ligase [uncultured archaeon]|nr:Lysine--tRNA ligase [uncultured archaeon]
MTETPTPPIAEHRHWVEQLGQSVLDRGSGPYTITGGMTTSGPAHMGTLCEMLYPQAVAHHLQRMGKKVRYIFIADILDAFDGVPVAMQPYSKQLEPHLGKPLCDVPDPTGRYPSFGDYFLNESLGIAKQFGVSPQLVRAQELYTSGAMDESARLFVSKCEQARELVARTSLRDELPADWHPLMPICSNCGRIATTRVTKTEGDIYHYTCDKDVKYTKGCGHSDSNSISDHRYKLTWRLHWPAWMKHFHTSIEGAGMDHHTRGGSWDTAQAVFREIFNQEPPVGYQFGFVLFQGKKYSKSKGIGMGLSDLLKLQPAPVLAYALLRPDLMENRDINPTSENLLRLIAEYEEAGALAAQMGLLEKSDSSESSQLVHQSTSPAAEVSRAERKRALAYSLAASRPLWSIPFSDLLIYYGLYGDLERVAAALNQPDDVRYLAPYILEWEKQNLIPDIYRFKFQNKPASSPQVREWVQTLTPQMDALAIHNSVFNFARERKIQTGAMFQSIYTDLIAKPHGPKLGRLVHILGVEKVRATLLGAQP